jgi:type II secretory pathway pseudopilin PulG
MGSSGYRERLKRGFSVFEIIGVIAVITIIMTMLVMSLGGIRPAADSKAAQSEIILIQQGLEAYKSRFGEYPKKVTVGGASPSMEVILFNALMGTLAPNGKLGNFNSVLDRTNLTFATTNFPLVGGTPALADNQLLDPWGVPYQYRYDPDDASWENFSYVLFSAGPNGIYTDVTAAGQINDSGAGNQDNIYAE